jgi:hypothetical protein
MGNREVVVYAYDPVEWPRDLFASSLDQANRDFLLDADILALEDHPDDVESVAGVVMNQGTYAIVFVQDLSKLNHFARILGKKDFYKDWPDEYLDVLFAGRIDPRL